MILSPIHARVNPQVYPNTPPNAWHPILFGKAKLNVEVKTLPFETKLRKLDKVKIFTGSAFPEFAKLVADKLGLPVSKSELKTFPDGSTFARIDETVRRCEVVIVQPTCRTPNGRSPNDNLMETAQLNRSAKKSGARFVMDAIPGFAYSRSDRSVKDREVAAAELATGFLTSSGAKHILTGDLHNKAVTSFTKKSFDSLKMLWILAQYVKENYDLSKVVVVSPDHGGTKRATQFANALGKAGYVGIMDKRRDADGRLLKDQPPQFIGNPEHIKGKIVVMPDDIIDTAGTICLNAEALMNLGAKKVIVAATHGFFSTDPKDGVEAIDRIRKSKISEVIVSNTIPLSKKVQRCSKITQVSIAAVFAEYISRYFGSDESTADLKE